MRAPSFLRGLLVAVPAGFALLGCGQILGLDGFQNACGGDLDAPCDGAGGSLTQSSASGAGGSALCSPGETRSCYTGDPATEDKGICHGGTKTCGNNGLFGDCEGEVLPKEHEDCGNAVDDDCNDMVNDLCPCMQGETQACYGGDMSTVGVGVCKAGTQACLPGGVGFGPCTGDVEPGAEDFDHQGDENCDGIPSADTLWVQTFSAVGTNRPEVDLVAVAPDADGSVYVGGNYNGASLTMGDVMLPGENSPLTTHAVAAKLGPDGTVVWAKSFTGGSSAKIQKVAVDAASGHVIVAGVANGAIDFGGSTTPVPAGTFVAAVDVDGNTIWSTGCSDAANIAGLAVDDAGKITLGGNVFGTTPFSCGPQSFTPPTNSTASIVLARFSSAGAPDWVSGMAANSASATLSDLALAPDGSAWFTGVLVGGVFFGSNASGNGAGGFLLAHARAIDGQGLFARAIGDGASISMGGPVPGEIGRGIAVDADSNVYVAGSNCGVMNFDGQVVTAVGALDVIAAAFDPTGAVLWVTSYDGNDDSGNVASLVELQPGGDLLVAGTTVGRLDLGLGINLSNFASYAFLTRQATTGVASPPTTTWNRFYGGDKTMAAARVFLRGLAGVPRAQPGAKDVALVGYYESPADFGTGTKPQTGTNSSFVMKVAP